MRLAHVGVAVKNLDQARSLFAKLFGSNPAPIETVTEQKVNISSFHHEGVELTEPSAPGSPVGKFLEKRGEGIHHLSFEVDDLEAELARLRREGFQLIDEKPRIGAGGHLIAFLHPRSTNGVLVELTQLRRS